MADHTPDSMTTPDFRRPLTFADPSIRAAPPMDSEDDALQALRDAFWQSAAGPKEADSKAADSKAAAQRTRRTGRPLGRLVEPTAGARAIQRATGERTRVRCDARGSCRYSSNSPPRPGFTSGTPNSSAAAGCTITPTANTGRSPTAPQPMRNSEPRSIPSHQTGKRSTSDLSTDLYCRAGQALSRIARTCRSSCSHN